MRIRSILLLLVGGILSLCWMACATEVEPASQETVELSTASQDTLTPIDDGPVTQARSCQQTCPAEDASGADCGTFLGLGRTTFLGSCSKACSFARDDAARQAAAVGCHLSGGCTGGC
jgi:hypothetical protein